MIFQSKCITCCACQIQRCLGIYGNRCSNYLPFSSKPLNLHQNMEPIQLRHSSTFINGQYAKAIIALNGLQSNAETLEKIRNRSLEDRRDKSSQNLKIIQNYLERIGVSLCDLDRLSIIHVSGTKGKGSTCAFIESILKEHGYKTGFFSSPHLVAVRERIRINGFPIPKKEFSYYFWDVYSKLSSLKENENDMPAYFQFLTILAFNVFLQEEVDVAIMEVGIGGEYDCTNVVRNPVVCGITSLDIDHTAILGATIEEIAWHKAGIIKPGVLAYTVPQQPSTALKVMQERAKEKNSELLVVPSLESYGWGGKPIHLGLSGYVQFLNASLALQVSRYWIEQKGRNNRIVNELYGFPFELSEEEIACLANVVWPGRSQILDTEIATFFLDGAHTCSSIQNCVEWFKKSSLQLRNEKGGSVCNVLVFNLTGDRDCESMLELLQPCNFELAIFTTNLVSKDMSASSDQTNYTISEAAQIARCVKLQNIWSKLEQDSIPNNFSYYYANNSTSSSISMEANYMHPVSDGNANLTNCQQDDRIQERKSYCKKFLCIEDVLSYLSRDNQLCPDKEPIAGKLLAANQIHVLVTGSLHLVGGVLAILDPNLTLPNQSQRPIQGSIADYFKRKYNSSLSSTPGAP